MMIVRCPECSARFKAPENMAGQTVRCAKCKAAFMVPKLDEPEEIEEVEQAPRSRRPARDDEVRPARRRPRDDDNEDDYDDEYDDDPEERERRKAKKTAAAIRRARIGVLLNFIGVCLFVGALGLELLLFLIGFAGAAISHDVHALSGLPGIGNWITAAVGLGFLASGPGKYGARGLTIATAAVGALHLILLIVALLQKQTSILPGGFGMTTGRSFNIDWTAMITQQTYLIMLPMVGRLGVDVVTLLTAISELALWILLALSVRAVALNVKEHGVAGNCIGLVIAVPATVIGLLVIELIFKLIFENMPPTSMGGAKAVFFFMAIIPQLGLIGVFVFYLIVLNVARDVIYPRKPKGERG